SASSRIAATVSVVASSKPGSRAISSRSASSVITNCISASGARYWLMVFSDVDGTGSLRRGLFLQAGADHLLVELADARFWNGVDEVHAIRHRVLGDRAALRVLFHMEANRAFRGRLTLPRLHDNEGNRTLAPTRVGHADDR